MPTLGIDREEKEFFCAATESANAATMTGSRKKQPTPAMESANAENANGRAGAVRTTETCLLHRGDRRARSMHRLILNSIEDHSFVAN